MPVSSRRKDLRKVENKYTIIRDCVDGELQIKFRADKYLPRPNPADKSPENQTRYVAYLTRAVFYNVVKRTLGGMVGQIFARDPIVEVPEDLDVVINDATGFGVKLNQLAKAAAGLVVAHGRAGVFIDYPVTDAPATRAEIDAGDIRPTIKLYEPWMIINWRTVKRGGREILSMVVLEETYIKEDDGFEEKEGKQWRVLRLTTDGTYRQELWRDNQPNTPFETFNPVDSNGEPLTEIPFTFIGAEDNDPTIDEPPMFDLASLNVAHYRNSADYEESCYITGQPTPYFTGLTESWVTNILKGTIQLGARAAVPLPVGAQAGMLQADPNSLPFEAMEHKERQMVALGAKLVEQQAVQRTATEAGLEHSDETSILSASADNVSDAFTYALKWCGVFMGLQTVADLQTDDAADDETDIPVLPKPPIDPEDPAKPPPDPANPEDPEDPAAKEKDTNKFVFVLNTEFDLIKLTPEERRQVIEEWQASAISWTEMRENMRRGGIASQDDAKAQAEIKANPPPSAVAAQAQLELAKSGQQQMNGSGGPPQPGKPGLKNKPKPPGGKPTNPQPAK